MKILRHEEWQRTFADEGADEPNSMITTTVVVVWDGEKVLLHDSVVHELELDVNEGEKVVLPGTEVFVWSFDYDKVAPALETKGWERVSSKEA